MPSVTILQMDKSAGEKQWSPGHPLSGQTASGLPCARGAAEADKPSAKPCNTAYAAGQPLHRQTRRTGRERSAAQSGFLRRILPAFLKPCKRDMVNREQGEPHTVHERCRAALRAGPVTNTARCRHRGVPPHTRMTPPVGPGSSPCCR